MSQHSFDGQRALASRPRARASAEPPHPIVLRVGPTHQSAPRPTSCLSSPKPPSTHDSPTTVPFAPAPHFPLPLPHTRPHLRCHRRSRRAASAAAPSPVTWCPAALSSHRRPPRILRGAVAEITICFRAPRNRRSSVGDQMIKLSEFYEVEDPEHLFGEGCLWCNLYSSKEEGVEADLQEFQDFDEFED
ncbi:thyroid receptor-interacting protein 6 [Zea mays]|uniref:thyroid receptor-interacting protein 6 n=1 Tax=Zea mays TaxID=4577 RepID=UPI0009A9AFE3|nr:thyroid receptor-interacting protein 6 [Zea mays]|eukprot:XP_020404419.1 thyroid receptor-interacting protein 6 [Zea mays]